MARQKKAKTLACRFCGDVLENAGNRDELSGWTHNHPSVCPYRTDRMPSLNGVHVGDVWRNLHTTEEREVTEIRLGGAGTYTDREPVVVFGDSIGIGGWPLWSLVEHWESVTRPGESPVPWTRERNGYRGRSALLKWRCAGYRGRKSKRQKAYWHSYHSVRDYSIEWEKTNVIWQMNPVAEAEREQRERALEYLDTITDPYLAATVAAAREMLEAAA